MKIRQTVVLWGLIAVLAPSMVHAQASTLADGTVVHVRLTADLLSSWAVVGSRVELEIAQPVILEGVVVIPTGSPAWGSVRAVKKGKILHFDIEAMRLPNREIVLLRCSPQRTTQAKKDEIKVEIWVGRELGAPKGIEFTAYLDQDVNVDVAGEPVAPAQPTPVAHPAPATRPGQYNAVVCFSAPAGADIFIDDGLRGSTPLSLDLLPGNYQIEFRLKGYKSQSQPLVLTPGTGMRTVVITLEKQQ